MFCNSGFGGETLCGGRTLFCEKSLRVSPDSVIHGGCLGF